MQADLIAFQGEALSWQWKGGVIISTGNDDLRGEASNT